MLKDPVLLLILCIACVLIFANLGNMYLWQDEAETACLSKNVLKFGFPRGFDGRNFVDNAIEYRPNYAWIYHPWLEFYLTAGFFAVFGYTTLIARLPFAIFGFFSVFLIYFLTKRLSGSVSIARLAAFLLTFSVPFLLFARQCRWYALAVFFTLWLLLCYLDFIEGKKGGAFKLAVSSILFFHSTHGIFIGVFAGILIHYTLFHFRSRPIKQIIWVFGAIAFFTLPWLFYSIAWQHFTFLYKGGWQRQPFELNHLRQNLELYVRVINKYVVPLAFLTTVVVFRFIRKKYNPFAKTLKAGSAWLIGLVVLSSLFLLLFVDQRHFRYIANLIPLFLILEAAVLFDWFRSSKLLAGFIITAVICSSFLNSFKLKFPLMDYLYEITHDYDCPNEGVVKYLIKEAKPGQTVKIPYEWTVLMFYTDLIVENPLNFKEETYPDWIVLRKDWIGASFFKSDYFKRIQRDYDMIVLDYPDIMWGNRSDMGYHKYRTVKDAPRVTIFRKKGI